MSDTKIKHNTPALRIAANADSFFRCGVEFTREQKDFPAGHFSETEVQRLKGTSTLVVVELPAAKAAKPEGDAKGDGKPTGDKK